MRGERAVRGAEAILFIIMQGGDLAAAQDGFEREAHEEFCEGGEEGAEGVGGGREDWVDAECGAQDEWGRAGY